MNRNTLNRKATVNSEPNPRGRRVAFCTVPHVGGIYSIYQKMRESLGEMGWDVLGVQVGDERGRWDYCEERADDGIRLVAPKERDLRRAGQQFCRWLTDEGISIVIPMSSPAAMASVPHLPANIKVVTRCISTNIQAYRLAASDASRLSRIVVTTPRQREEIARRFKIAEDRFRMIPNAVNTNVFVPKSASHVGRNQRLSIVYLGRLIQLSKNVLALPAICDELENRSVPFKLTIVGSGIDEPELRGRMSTHLASGKVEFRGALERQEIISVLQNSDCFVLPSEEEGFPNALIEAMSCGSVPVVSALRGVTDWIITDSVDGRLCRYDRPDAFAAALCELHRSPEQRRLLSEKSRATVVDRFSIDAFRASWDQLFREVLASSQVDYTPREWDAFVPPAAFRASRFAWIPRDLRNRLRTILDNMGMRTR